MLEETLVMNQFLVHPEQSFLAMERIRFSDTDPLMAGTINNPLKTAEEIEAEFLSGMPKSIQDLLLVDLPKESQPYTAGQCNIHSIEQALRGPMEENY